MSVLSIIGAQQRRAREIALLDLGFTPLDFWLNLSIGSAEKPVEIQTEASPSNATKFTFKVAQNFEGQRVEMLHTSANFEDFIGDIIFFIELLK